MKKMCRVVRKATCAVCLAAAVWFPCVAGAASFVSSHESYNSQEHRYTYEGMVRISIDGMSITCDKAVWKPEEKSLHANGNVDLRDGSATFRAVSLSMEEGNGKVSLSGDGYFHVMGWTVTAGNISYDKETDMVYFSSGVLVSGNATKKLYHSAVYDLSAKQFVEFVE